MERESPESEITTEHLMDQVLPKTPVRLPPSAIDLAVQHTRTVNKIATPEILDLIAGIQRSITRTTLAEVSANHYSALNRINKDLTRALASSPGIQAIRDIASSALMTQIAQMQAHWRESFERLYSSFHKELSASLAPLIELARRFGEVSRVRDAFCHYNLWLAPSMSEELVAKIVSLYDAKASSRTVHSVVSRYYAKDDWSRLDEVLQRCVNNPLFGSRIGLIQEALQAHRQAMYALTVTGLLVHVEGIAADYVKRRKLLPQVGRKTKKIILTALSANHSSFLDIRTYAGVSSLITYLENSMYATVDFDAKHDRLQNETRLVGHAIRHGRQASIGTRMNSLRLFLILDVMALLEI